MKKGDYIIILAVLLIEAMLFYIFIWKANSQDSQANIYQQGQLIQTISLSQNQSNIIFNGKIGEVMLEVKDGKIRFVAAVCPDHVCTKTGWIATNGRVAACIPNDILVEISTAEQQEWDVIVG